MAGPLRIANHGIGHETEALRPQTAEVNNSFAFCESPKLSISSLRELHEPFPPR